MPSAMADPSKAEIPKARLTASDALTSAERASAARVAALMSRSSTKGGGVIQVANATGEHVELPAPLADALLRAAELIAEGRPVTVLADETMLTTQAAADILNVSRQYLVRLVDSGRLPAVRVGSHRRLFASDVAALKVARDRDRDAALDRLVALSEAAGGYAWSPAQGLNAE